MQIGAQNVSAWAGKSQPIELARPHQLEQLDMVTRILGFPEIGRGAHNRFFGVSESR